MQAPGGNAHFEKAGRAGACNTDTPLITKEVALHGNYIEL
jgi:hypothetical protein